MLTLTNYSLPSHNIAFLRSLSEDRDQRLVEAWPRDLIETVCKERLEKLAKDAGVA